jgi:hypothetical protein
MLDGLGMAETTPGPLIIVLQFAGFMAASATLARCRRCSPARLGALLTGLAIVRALEDAVVEFIPPKSGKGVGVRLKS